jgi:hypothetical protein
MVIDAVYAHSKFSNCNALSQIAKDGLDCFCFIFLVTKAMLKSNYLTIISLIAAVGVVGGNFI